MYIIYQLSAERQKSGRGHQASGDSYGVGVATSYVTVSGLTVETASVGGVLADGIVIAVAVSSAYRRAVAGDFEAEADREVRERLVFAQDQQALLPGVQHPPL
jgi:hypothetical protein